MEKTQYMKAYRAKNAEALKAYNRAYREAHAEVFKVYDAMYREKNKDKLKIWQRTPYHCECGAVVATSGKIQHLKSKKHQQNCSSISTSPEGS